MASKLFPHVFTPGRIGTLELKNRVMKAPQSSGMSNKDGTVSERLIRYYRNQASGGAGMIIVEYTAICVSSFFTRKTLVERYYAPVVLKPSQR